MGYRNPVESVNGVVKNRHGLQHNTCHAIGLEPHAFAAAITAAVRNLQLTLEDELIDDEPAPGKRLGAKPETRPDPKSKPPTTAAPHPPSEQMTNRLRRRRSTLTQIPIRPPTRPRRPDRHHKRPTTSVRG